MKKILFPFIILSILLAACAPQSAQTAIAQATTTAPAPTIAPAVTEAPTVAPTATAINFENLQPGLSVPMDIKSSKGSEIVNGNFSSHVVGGSLHGGISLFEQRDNPFGSPDMIPMYVYIQDGVSGPYFHEVQRPGVPLGASLTGLVDTNIAKRYAADNKLKLNMDAYTQAFGLMERGKLPIHFTTSEGDFTYYPSPDHGYKVFYVPWENADPAKDPRFIEYNAEAHWRVMTTLDDQGNLVSVIASDKPFDQIKDPKEVMEYILLGLARVIDNADQSKTYFMNHQLFNGLAFQLGDFAINKSTPSIQLSNTP